MSNKHWIWVTVGCVLLAAVLTFSVTSLYWVNRTAAANDAALTGVEADGALYDAAKLAEIENKIERYYIDRVDPDYMTEKIAAAMIEGLDDEWSYYIPAEEYASYLDTVNNAYVGIGVTIQWENEDPQGFTVTDVTPDSPAYRAGIQIGDYLYKVDGEPVTELGMQETKNRVRGEAGTAVELTLVRDGEELVLKITRASIQTVNVSYELLEDGIAYIRIRNFESRAAQESIAAIEDVVAQGAKGIVFDVRFNPGGFKDELVKLLDYLLPEGVLFRSLNYDGQELVDYSDARHLELPMAVLVNVDSYSAAEFFAAALQEYGAATVVGTQTYGKGKFQTTHSLSDGSAVHISTGKYFTPNGVSLSGVGITPDQVVELTDEQLADLYYNRLAHAEDAQLLAAAAAVRAGIK